MPAAAPIGVDALPCLQSDLQRMERALAARVVSSIQRVTELSAHLVEAGGKRVRPALCLIASQVHEPDSAPARPEAVQGAVAVELVHIGTLCHDDVLDNAETRRSAPSVNAKWGNQRAILAGDYLLSRAGEVAASLGSEVAGLIAETITRLCEGQIVELETAYDTSRSEHLYEQAIEGKTAVLLSSSCRIGAMAADLPSATADALGEFGHAYGMAFQVVDDILDVTATSAQTGKPVGHDLIEGIYTLPVIRALNDPVLGDELRSMLGRRIGRSTRDRARELVLSTSGVAEAQAVAKSWAAKSQALLEDLPDNPAKASLRTAADRLLDRVGLGAV